MQWTSDAIAKLFMHVLKIHEVKIDYAAVAKAMGEDCTPKAVTHQIAKLKAMSNQANTASPSNGDSGPSTPPKGGSVKRGRTKETPKPTGKRNAAPKSNAEVTTSSSTTLENKDGTPLNYTSTVKYEESDEDDETETPKKKLKISHSDADGDDESAVNATPTPKRKSKVVKGEGRKPSAAFAKYNTDHYTVYNHNTPHTIAAFTKPFTKFSDYDNYELYINPQLTDLSTIPTSGVRLDDLTISRVLTKFKASKLHENWPADLDKHGMVRATRVPLGCAAKMWVDVGEKDVHGNVVNEGQEGYYYKWWRGLHCLMGKEGLDAEMYIQRPSHEHFICDGFGFKIDCKAVIQEAEDHVEGEDEGGVGTEVEEDEIKGEEAEDGVEEEVENGVEEEVV